MTIDSHHYLSVYLNDHLAGATAGEARLARSARAHAGMPVGIALESLRREVAEDRQELMRCMTILGVERRKTMRLVGRPAEIAGAVKPNGHVVRGSPLRTVVELEGLLLGVTGKAAMWRSLLELAHADPRLDGRVLEALQQRAARQSGELERLRGEAVAEVLGGSGDSSGRPG